MGLSFEQPSEPERINCSVPKSKDAQDVKSSVAYCGLYLFFRLGKNNCRWYLSINIRPSFGVLLKSSISRVSQNLGFWPNMALKVAKKMRLKLQRHACSETRELNFVQVSFHSSQLESDFVEERQQFVYARSR